jgi:hypothetical protein
MDTEKKNLSFVAAVRAFFGQKSGQTLLEFKDEISALTPTDRKELADMLSVALNAVVAY